MDNSDVLIEFEKTDHPPKSYRYIIFLVLLIICSYVAIAYPSFKSSYISAKEFWHWRTYFYFLAFLYPVIGLQGYMLLKKYGWFILAHYTLTSTALIFITGVYTLIEDRFSFLKLLVILAFIFINTISCFLLLRKNMLQFFQITKENILLFILLTVVFTISHIAILILG